jgi:futalosine hydrolase
VLILVPTEYERDLLFADQRSAQVVVCGFGLAAAGVNAAHAIATVPAAADGVVLIGAAGTYDENRHPLGSALVAGAVECDGIGAGGKSAAELGFGGEDTLTLSPPGGPALVSVAQASADPHAAGVVAARHPGAAAEEMEGYVVALAAVRFGVPVSIVRGISNRAGDRDHSRWRMAEALAAARDRLSEVVT